MIGTPSLSQLVRLAEREHWRLALVGDPRQLQAVGRGGLFNELCATGRTLELTRIHRFRQPWEAAASLQLRDGNPAALDAYEAHDRIIAGPFEAHLDALARQWCELTGLGAGRHHRGHQRSRRRHQRRHPDAVAWPRGDLAGRRRGVRRRRRDRLPGRHRRHPPQRPRTPHQPKANRSATANCGTSCPPTPMAPSPCPTAPDTAPSRFPPTYVRDHVRLGYAATEHGNQGDTVDVGLQLVSPATTRRGLYVGATRGRDDNRMYVVTETTDPPKHSTCSRPCCARDRADIPAVTQRRQLAGQEAPHSSNQRQSELIPAWLGPERDRLVDRRDELIAGLTERAERRAEAAAQHAELQPALDAARAAWEPYELRIRQVDAELRRELRPAMWRANAMRCEPASDIATRLAAEPREPSRTSATRRLVSTPHGPREPPPNSTSTHIQTQMTSLEHLANPAPYGIPVDQADLCPTGPG